MRHLTDGEGREWRIYERITGHSCPGRAASSLVFDADSIIRRLWRFPAAWSTMPDAELLHLMDTVPR